MLRGKARTEKSAPTGAGIHNSALAHLPALLVGVVHLVGCAVLVVVYFLGAVQVDGRHHHSAAHRQGARKRRYSYAADGVSVQQL